MLDKLNEMIRRKGGPLNECERFAVLEEMVAGLSPKNKLNLLIFDGELLYVHNNCRGSLYTREQEDSTTISTKPLCDGRWEDAPFTRLVSYKDGIRWITGCNHGNEYIPDSESIKALYLMYSHL